METVQPQYPVLDIKALNPPMNTTLVTDATGLAKLADYIERVKAQATPMFCLDTETNYVKDFYFRKVRTIQVGDKDEQYVIDLLAFAGSKDRLMESQGQYGVMNGDIYKPVLDILAPVLCSNAVLKVGQNLGFEYQVLKWNFGLRIWNLFSTDMAERVIQAGAIPLLQMTQFSMAAIVRRHFKLEISKDEQEGFDLETPLTPSQIEYAAFDVRMPMSMRQKQMQLMIAQQLVTTAQIENDAIGSFTDMHLWGQRLDKERWIKRIENTKARRVEELKILDAEFLKYVGHKMQQIDFVEMERREKLWREGFEAATQAEMDKAMEVRLERDKLKKLALKEELKALEKQRKDKKAAARVAYNDMSKKHTVVKNLLPDCEGEAYINYGSNDQLLEALNKMPGLRSLSSVADDALLDYNNMPMIQTLRKYRKGKKDTGTYGLQWTQQWVTKPCKEEGWLHPFDGRLHCEYNQLQAETGRTTSSRPNAQNLPKDDEVRACFICDPPDAEEPEGYCIVTVDMSGAELRIIAELANATTWIQAFAKGWDVHSVSTEILEPQKWPAMAQPDCAYYKKDANGEPQRQKCKCPGHVELRNKTKAINFLLCYGGGPDALADELGITVDAAKELMRQHEKAFPDVWGYLNRSGELAKRNKEARDMYGRRRLFPPPTWERSREWYMDEHADRLELPEEVQKSNIFQFMAANMRKPNVEEKFKLTHRNPTDEEIKQAMRGLIGSIGRRGKNHCIQGSNASIIKRAMGCGFDKEASPTSGTLCPSTRRSYSRWCMTN